jgi:hypothetical protein
LCLEKNASQDEDQSTESARQLGRLTTIVAAGRFLAREFWTWPLIAAAVLGGAGWWVNRSVDRAMRQQRIDLNAILEANLAPLCRSMDHQPYMLAVVPTRDEQGRPIAALGLRLRPSEFSRIFQVTRSADTGDSYAPEGGRVLLVQSRFDDKRNPIGLLVDREGSQSILNLDETSAPVYLLRRAFALLMGLLIGSAVAMLAGMRLFARKQPEPNDAARTAKFGPYTLVEKLGKGAMGTVYKAQHALLRRPTAIKLLNPELVSDSGIARFEREVQLTSGLSHPNTVAIYDYGRTPDGVFYYAMEYLEGMNLDEFVHRYGALSEARAIYILRQVCASLAEAHAAGLVHRDVKPANILLTVRGGQHDFVKVLDFGLAKLARGCEAHLTANNVLAGTPLYISPEAIAHPEQIDARADVYAIGAVGYFLLTGSPVFGGSSAADICLMHAQVTPEPPSARAKRPVSSALESLLLRCLAKSPADRPDDAADLLHLLESCPKVDRWTAGEAARWWANRNDEHSAATASSASVAVRSAAAPAADGSGSFHRVLRQRARGHEARHEGSRFPWCGPVVGRYARGCRRL